MAYFPLLHVECESQKQLAYRTLFDVLAFSAKLKTEELMWLVVLF